MNEMERAQFINRVAEVLTENPELAGDVAKAVSAGVSRALAKARRHAADMETVACMLASRKSKHSDNLIRNKLKEMRGQTYFNWDWLTEQEREG